MALNNIQRRAVKDLKKVKSKITPSIAAKMLSNVLTDQEVADISAHLQANKDNYYSIVNSNYFNLYRVSLSSTRGIVPGIREWGYCRAVGKVQLRKDPVYKKFEKDLKAKLKEKFGADAILTLAVKYSSGWGQPVTTTEVVLEVKGTCNVILDDYLKRKDEARRWLRELRSERATLQKDIDALEEVITDE